MKKIEIIEKKSGFSLEFSTPEADLNKEQLSKLIGGATGCKCRKAPFHDCVCYKGATLVDLD
ncbi:MAG: hypothetical protein KAT68_09090 [Bacteroidales bacterium]|nr:hypothetical protein [Bacteroidales bacterium]